MAIQSIKKLEDYSPSPAGANQQIQYNNNGVLGASSNFVIDGSGNVGIGTSSPSVLFSVVSDINTGAHFEQYTNSSSGPSLRFDKGRGTEASKSSILSNDSLGSLLWSGWSTSSQRLNGSSIESYASQNWGSNSGGAYITFSTTPDGGTAYAERMRIDGAGNVAIGTTTTTNARLMVQDTANGDIFRGINSNASYSNVAGLWQINRAATTSYKFGQWYAISDLEFQLDGDGNAYADGAWNGSGADYQEYFESQLGAAAEVGRTVVLDGGQIRYYNAATDSVDDIIGVTRPEADNKNSAVVGNLAWNHWTDKYLTDDWGVYEREDITVYQWEVETVTHTVQQYSNLWHYSHGDVSEYVPVGSVTIPADAVQTTDNVRKLNPAFDPAQAANYKSREDRDEWWLIGLLGQIQIKAGEPTNPRWIKMKDISANVELWYVR